DGFVEWVKRPRSTTSARTACSRLGYQAGHRWLGFVAPQALERFGAFERLPDSESFPAGVITLGSGRFGFIRVPTYETSEYPEVCALVWPKVAKSVTFFRGCDAGCKRRVEFLMHEQLVQELS